VVVKKKFWPLKSLRVRWCSNQSRRVRRKQEPIGQTNILRHEGWNHLVAGFGRLAHWTSEVQFFPATELVIGLRSSSHRFDSNLSSGPDNGNTIPVHRVCIAQLVTIWRSNVAKFQGGLHRSVGWYSTPVSVYLWQNVGISATEKNKRYQSGLSADLRIDLMSQYNLFWTLSNRII
jgi:hypothetical protein